MNRPRKLDAERESWARAIREHRTIREIGALLGVSRNTVQRTLRPTLRLRAKLRHALGAA